MLSSPSGEEGKSSGSSSSGLKRRLGQKTNPTETGQTGSSKQFVDESEKDFGRAVGMELDKPDKPKDLHPKGDDLDYAPCLMMNHGTR